MYLMMAKDDLSREKNRKAIILKKRRSYTIAIQCNAKSVVEGTS